MAPNLQDFKIRGRRTAYHYYVQSCRAEFERDHPDETPNFTEFMTDCLTRWDAMSDLDKAPFQGLSAADKVRYDNELLQHGLTAPDNPPKESRKRKQDESTNANQQLPAFYWFCNDMRNIVMTENPEFDQGEVAVEMGRRWIASPVEIKQKYEEIAETKQNQYELEKSAHKRK